MRPKEVTKACLKCLDNPSWDFEFPFNPEADSLKLSRGVMWAAEGSGYDPWGGPLDYEAGQPDRLSFTVLLDETLLDEIDLDDFGSFEAAMLAMVGSLLGLSENDESILPSIEKLWRLTVPVKPKGFAPDSFDVRPPIVAFVWEAFVFVGAVTDLNVSFLLMDHLGKARRAKVDLELKGRAFAGSTSLADFLDATYAPPSLTGSGAAVGGSRDDLVRVLS